MGFYFQKHHCLGFPLLIIQVLTLVYKRDQDKKWYEIHKQKQNTMTTATIGKKRKEKKRKEKNSLESFRIILTINFGYYTKLPV